MERGSDLPSTECRPHKIKTGHYDQIKQDQAKEQLSLTCMAVAHDMKARARRVLGWRQAAAIATVACAAIANCRMEVMQDAALIIGEENKASLSTWRHALPAAFREPGVFIVFFHIKASSLRGVAL